MKFRKKFSKSTEETLPGWRDKYLDYKDLKQVLKLMYPDEYVPMNKQPTCNGDAMVNEDCEDGIAKMDSGFEEKLDGQVHKFNFFFMEKEEEYIIRWKLLQEFAANAKEPEEVMRVRRELLDFHGEMVLLQSYSALNFIGLVKILKKYDKRSGSFTSSPFIRKLVRQPFFSTEVLNRIVKDCERALDNLFFEAEQLFHINTSGNQNDGNSIEVPAEIRELLQIESKFMRLALLVLETLKEIRRESSTVSAYSLPPMQI